MLKLGAHLSISGGYDQALRRVKAIGGNCLQMFSGSPRFWRRPVVSQDEINKFVSLKKELAIEPVFFHALYLVNLASLTETAAKSVTALRWELNLAPKMGVKGTVIHLGSYLKNDKKETFKVLLKNIELVLEAAPDNAWFIIENAAGNKIGQTAEEIFEIINSLKDKRLKICWDTCHGFAAGIDISTTDKLEKLLTKIDKNVGLDRLVLWHLNDSRDPFNSHRDRHANIGQGYIGLETFATILNHPLANKVAMIIETPGFAGRGPDKENLDILKNLLKKQ